MRTEMRMSDESFIKLKLHKILEYITKPFYIIYYVVKLIIIFFLHSIFNLWDKIYNFLYEHKDYLSKILLKIVGIVELIILAIFCFQYFYNNDFQKELLIIMLKIGVATASIFLILYLYHIFFGKDQLIKQYILITDYYIENCIAQIIKIFGPPRIGKDTTGIAITSILARRNRRIIPMMMARIKKICYIFDYQKINNVCMLYYKLFTKSSRKERQKGFIRLAASNTFKAFLSDRYLVEINYQELIKEYFESLNNKVDYKCKYMYDDGICKIHFLELICEYMFLYVRLYIVKNFVLINQPYIEEPETGLTGKVYSVYYEAVASKPDVSKTIQEPDGTRSTITYSEKVEMPILDWTIMNLTENDTWFSNMDGEVVKLINDSKIREFKAFYGHFYKQLYYIQICHDASRMNKRLRELDAFYVNILQRVEIPGARKRVFFLSIFQKVVDALVERSNLKLDDANNKIIFKSSKKIDYLQRLYDATMNIKYLEKIEKIEQKESKQSSKLHVILASLNKILLEKMDQLNREHGVIRITATISDQPTTPNLKVIPLKQLIQRDKPLYHESYKVDFYFRMKDSMGRYNHRYMESVLEDRAVKSQIDIMNVLNWDKRMELNRDIALKMGFPAGFKLFNITSDEIFNDRYFQKKQS